MTEDLPEKRPARRADRDAARPASRALERRIEEARARRERKEAERMADPQAPGGGRESAPRPRLDRWTRRLEEARASRERVLEERSDASPDPRAGARTPAQPTPPPARADTAERPGRVARALRGPRKSREPPPTEEKRGASGHAAGSGSPAQEAASVDRSAVPVTARPPEKPPSPRPPAATHDPSTPASDAGAAAPPSQDPDAAATDQGAAEASDPPPDAKGLGAPPPAEARPPAGRRLPPPPPAIPVAALDLPQPVGRARRRSRLVPLAAGLLGCAAIAAAAVLLMRDGEVRLAAPASESGATDATDTANLTVPALTPPPARPTSAVEAALPPHLRLVVITGADDGAMAERLGAEPAEVRLTDFAIAGNAVHFFSDEDADSAARVAASIGGEAVDLSGIQPPPPAGTLAVYLSGN